MTDDKTELFRWIANDIDVSELINKLPSYMLEMIDQIEQADKENNLPAGV